MAGDPLDETVLRSYALGAAHMALGWVCTESLTVDPATGTAAIRVSVSGALPVGTPVEIAIVAEERPNALIVPAAAINARGIR